MSIEVQQPNANDAKALQKTQNSPGDDLSNAVIGCAIEVQKILGPGLLESAYAAALAIELASRGIRYRREVPLQATYKGQQLGVAYRADFVVEERLLLELKAMDSISEPHRAQVLTYLRLADLRLGLLLNFNVIPVAGRGLTRVVNQL